MRGLLLVLALAAGCRSRMDCHREVEHVPARRVQVYIGFDVSHPLWVTEPAHDTTVTICTVPAR